jgi:hypothetical protein
MPISTKKKELGMSPDEPNIAIATLAIPDSLPRLGKGHHSAGSMTPCAMEAASWLAAEPWSDHPRTVHPVIARVARRVNDTVTDEERQGLWPLVLASLDTRRRGRLVLGWRLSRCARQASKQYPADARRWQAVLVGFGALTGRDPQYISSEREHALRARLDRPFDPEPTDREGGQRLGTAVSREPEPPTVPLS